METINRVNINDTNYNVEGSLLFIPENKITSTAGSSTSGKYLATKLKVTDIAGITTPQDGLTFAIRIPIAGASGGLVLSIDNGQHYYPIVRNVNTAITTQYPADSTMIVSFNSTQTAKTYLTSGTQTTVTGCWQIADYDSNTTYTNEKLGQGYGTCATAAATVAKAVTLSGYTLIKGGVVAVKFTYAVPANATMNINSKGAKSIYYKGAAITDGIICAGEVATFMYDGTRYHLLGVDRNRFYTTLVPMGVAIPENADLNTLEYLKVGNYYCSANAVTKTLLNCPTVTTASDGTKSGVAFMMTVSSPLSQTVDDESGTWKYRFRTLQAYDGPEYTQYCYSNGTAGNWIYGPWYKTIKTNDFDTKMDKANPTGTGSFSLNRLADTTIGNYSFAEGASTTSSGYAAHAEGLWTKATAQDSHAEGYYAEATGDHAHAEGGQTIASGAAAHAEGSNSNASGGQSHAEGSGTQAQGVASHAEGHGSIAIGYGSHAEGADINEDSPYETLVEISKTSSDKTKTYTFSNTTANGIGSHAEGIQTYADGYASHSEGFQSIAINKYSHAEGENTKSEGVSSHAEGKGTIASGTASHAEGYIAKASGNYSHAEGMSTTASGENSHAEGSLTKALGKRAHAEGQATEASGVNSHAEGMNTTASGDYSHSEGFRTTAFSFGSHAEGTSTIANSKAQHVQGEYNILDTESNSSRGTYAHIVGNGSATARSNAHTLDWSGNAWFAGDVYVGSTSGVNKDAGSKKLQTEITGTPGQFVVIGDDGNATPINLKLNSGEVNDEVKTAYGLDVDADINDVFMALLDSYDSKTLEFTIYTPGGIPIQNATISGLGLTESLTTDSYGKARCVIDVSVTNFELTIKIPTAWKDIVSQTKTLTYTPTEAIKQFVDVYMDRNQTNTMLSTSSTTFYLSPDVSKLKVSCVGGGGGGAAAYCPSTDDEGYAESLQAGGGGGGGYVTNEEITLSQTSHTIKTIVGAAGSGGKPRSSSYYYDIACGKNGGASYITIDGTTHANASGGTGGKPTSGGAGNGKGGNGGYGGKNGGASTTKMFYPTEASIGGGGGGGTLNNSVSDYNPGSGGSPYGGKGGTDGGSASTGSAGSGYGGGGGGGGCYAADTPNEYNSEYNAGGAGYKGVVGLLWEFRN